jgi:hypothetical protein
MKVLPSILARPIARELDLVHRAFGKVRDVLTCSTYMELKLILTFDAMERLTTSGFQRRLQCPTGHKSVSQLGEGFGLWGYSGDFVCCSSLPPRGFVDELDIIMDWRPLTAWFVFGL